MHASAPGVGSFRAAGARVALLLLALLAGGCGFHLRGTGEGARELPPVRVAGGEGDAVGIAIRRALPPPDPSGPAPLVLRLDDIERERRPVSVTQRARVAEYALLSAVAFTVIDAGGTVLVRDRLAVERIFRLDADNLLGASGEEEVLRAEMRRELVNGVLRRLAAEAETVLPAPGADP